MLLAPAVSLLCITKHEAAHCSPFAVLHPIPALSAPPPRLHSRPPYPQAVTVLAGAASRTLAQVAIHPLDTLKTRMQVGNRKEAS